MPRSAKACSRSGPLGPPRESFAPRRLPRLRKLLSAPAGLQGPAAPAQRATRHSRAATGRHGPDDVGECSAPGRSVRRARQRSGCRPASGPARMPEGCVSPPQSHATASMVSASAACGRRARPAARAPSTARGRGSALRPPPVRFAALHVCVAGASTATQGSALPRLPELEPPQRTIRPPHAVPSPPQRRTTGFDTFPGACWALRPAACSHRADHDETPVPRLNDLHR